MEFVTKEPDKENEGEYKDVTEIRTLNSMIPLWKKAKNEITDEEYASFYRDKFFDYNEPAKVIHYNTEGQATYNSLLFIF